MASIDVYRNLTRNNYSIRYKGHVIDHAASLWVTRPTFVVSQAGNERVRCTGQKNVHAYVRGENGAVEWPFRCGDVSAKGTLWTEVVYNPRTSRLFRTKYTCKPVLCAAAAILTPQGVFVLNPNYEM
jgi:hypothetical protein